MERDKCYPVSGQGHVTMCNHYKDGYCCLFTKQCNNTWEKKNERRKENRTSHS